jgi:hypothetical protein
MGPGPAHEHMVSRALLVQAYPTSVLYYCGLNPNPFNYLPPFTGGGSERDVGHGVSCSAGPPLPRCHGTG